jgi:hypothetical protein
VVLVNQLIGSMSVYLPDALALQTGDELVNERRQARPGVCLDSRAGSKSFQFGPHSHQITLAPCATECAHRLGRRVPSRLAEYS